MLKGSYTLYLISLITIPFLADPHPLWTQAVFQTMTGIGLITLLIHYRGSGQSMVPVPGLLPLLLLLNWFTFQLVPLPVAFVSLVSPSTVEAFKPLLLLNPDTNYITISLQPCATVYMVLRFASFVLFYILTVQLLREIKVFEKAVWVSIIVCFIVCFMGILQYFTDNSKLLWMLPSTQNERIFGPFNYKNQLAAYVTLMLPLVLFMMHNYQPKIYLRKTLRHMVTSFFNHRHSYRYLALSLAVVVMLASLLLSGPREVFVCGFMSLFIIVLLARKRSQVNFSLPILTVLSVLAVLSLGSLGLNTLDPRLDKASEVDAEMFDGRTELWETGVRMALDFPVTGSGVGTFPAMYPTYMKEPGKIAIYAHNDYLETLVDGGLVAAALGLWFFISYFSQTVKYNNKQRNSLSRYGSLSLCLYYGSLAGVTSLLLHSLVDSHFKLSIIVGLYFFFMLGIHAASTQSIAKAVQGSVPPKKVSPLCTPAVGGGALMLVIVSVSFTAGSLNAKADYFNSINPCKMAETEVKGIFENARQGVLFDPLQYSHHSAMAVSADKLENVDQARKSYADSIRLNPTNDMMLSLIALFLEKEGENELAGQFYKLAITRNPTFYGHHLMLADWLNNNNRKSEAYTAQRRVLQLNPEFSKSFFLILRQKQEISFEQIQEILPDRVVPHLAYASLLASEGDVLEAGEAYARALLFVSNEEGISPWFYLEPYHFYLKQGEFDKATGLLLQGVEQIPNDYMLHIELGEVLSRQQLNRRAIEHYQKALRLRPSDKEALAKIEAMKLSKY